LKGVEDYRLPKQAWQYHPQGKRKTNEEMVRLDLGAGTDQWDPKHEDDDFPSLSIYDNPHMWHHFAAEF